MVSYAGRESIGTERVRPVVRLDRPSLLAWFLMEATPLCDVRGQGYLVHAVLGPCVAHQKYYVCVSSFAKLWGRVGKMGKSSVGKISPGFRKKEPPASLGDLPLL